MTQPSRRVARVGRRGGGGRHFADEAFPVTTPRSRRLLTALVALAMTATMTFLPGTVQVVQAKEKELPAAAQKVETPAPSPTEAPEVVATAPAEEANAPAPEPVPDAATPTVEAVPAAESVAETPVIVEPTVVEADVATEGARAPPVEQTMDAAPAALEPAVEPAQAEGGIVPMNGSGDPDVSENVGCVAEHVDFDLNCTANDVRLRPPEVGD